MQRNAVNFFESDLKQKALGPASLLFKLTYGEGQAVEAWSFISSKAKQSKSCCNDWLS